MNRKTTIMGLVMMVAAAMSGVYGQVWSTDVKKVESGAITVDGIFSEGVWAGATKTSIDPATYLNSGIIDGSNDLSAQIAFFWDDDALYAGLWFTDDIHNAPHSIYPEDALNAYGDDGVEWFVNYNFDDAHADITDSPYGLYGEHLVKGFGNLSAAEQYAGLWDEGRIGGGIHGEANYTPAEAEAIGWYETFASADGLSYTDELKLTWAGAIMVQHTAAVNDRIAFGAFLNDNDGAFAAEGTMHWPGPFVTGDTFWGQLTLSATMAGVKPIRSVSVPKLAPTGNGTYDIRGRLVASTRATKTAQVLIGSDGKVARRLIIR